jgi:hypothetical protein
LQQTFHVSSLITISSLIQASEAMLSPQAGPVLMKRKISHERKESKSINQYQSINLSINQKHTISNEYDELFADMQALAFVVSSRRMLPHCHHSVAQQPIIRHRNDRGCRQQRGYCHLLTHH